MAQAEVADFHEAVRQNMLEEPTETLHDVKASRAEACTAHCPGGAGDRAVRQADETVVGDGDLEAIGGKVRAGGMAVGLRLTVDMPGDGPGLRVDVLQETSVTHRFFDECTVNGGEGFDGDQAGRS